MQLRWCSIRVWVSCALIWLWLCLRGSISIEQQYYCVDNNSNDNMQWWQPENVNLFDCDYAVKMSRIGVIALVGCVPRKHSVCYLKRKERLFPLNYDLGSLIQIEPSAVYWAQTSSSSHRRSSGTKIKTKRESKFKQMLRNFTICTVLTNGKEKPFWINCLESFKKNNLSIKTKINLRIWIFTLQFMKTCKWRKPLHQFDKKMQYKKKTCHKYSQHNKILKTVFNCVGSIWLYCEY